MVNKEDILYNEIVGLRKDIKDILSSFDKRISVLESLKDKALGAFCFMGMIAGMVLDYVKTRIG